MPHGGIGCIHIGSPKCGVRLTKTTLMSLMSINLDGGSQMGDFSLPGSLEKIKQQCKKGWGFSSGAGHVPVLQHIAVANAVV